MTKQELVSQVAKATGIEKTAVQLVIDEAAEAVKQTVSQGEEVTLRGFGTFLPQFAAGKTARNITTGEEVRVPAHYKPKFKPSKEFKESVGKIKNAK